MDKLLLLLLLQEQHVFHIYSTSPSPKHEYALWYASFSMYLSTGVLFTVDATPIEGPYPTILQS